MQTKEEDLTKPAFPSNTAKAQATPAKDKAPVAEKAALKEVNEHEEGGKKAKLHPVDSFISKIRHSFKKLPLMAKADEMFYSGVKAITGFGIHNALDFQVEGKEHIPIMGKAILVTVADNIMTDMAVIVALSDRPVHFMLTPKLFKMPVVSSVLDALGMYRSTLDKDDMEPIEKTMHYLNEEKSLVAMTPEAKLEPEVQVKTMASILKFAIAAKAPIVPVAIAGTKALGWKKPLRVHVGAPIEVPADLQRDKKRDARYARAKEIVGAIHAMKDALASKPNEKNAGEAKAKA